MDFHIATEREFPNLSSIKNKFGIFRVLVFDFKKLFYIELFRGKGSVKAYGKTKEKAFKKELKQLKNKE